MARIEALWIKRADGGPMDPARRVAAVAGEGLRGNADQGGWRQVTVIEREVFDRIREELPDAEPSMRRANVLVSGVKLEDTRDHVLHLGGVRIRIRGETRPCHRMDEQCPGLRAALKSGWGGGAFGVVLDDGEIRVGDPVRLEAPAEG